MDGWVLFLIIAASVMIMVVTAQESVNHTHAHDQMNLDCRGAVVHGLNTEKHFCVAPDAGLTEMEGY